MINNIYLQYLNDPYKNRQYLLKERKKLIKQWNKKRKGKKKHLSYNFPIYNNNNIIKKYNTNNFINIYIFCKSKHIIKFNNNYENCFIQRNPLEALVLYFKEIIFTCPVCLDNSYYMTPIILKCGHCLCLTCYKNLTNNKCVLCRSLITRII